MGVSNPLLDFVHLAFQVVNVEGKKDGRQRVRAGAQKRTCELYDPREDGRNRIRTDLVRLRSQTTISDFEELVVVDV